MPRFALVSREVFPFGGGGLGVYVTATAEALAALGDVRIFTTDTHRETYENVLAERSFLFPEGVELTFVPEPRRYGGFSNALHAWSARAFEALKRMYPGGGPDLVEFPDYLGEGAVTTQAKRTFDPAVRETTVCIRCHTPYEMIAVLNGAVSRDLRTRMTFDLERYALENADRLLWPGGDVLDTFRRFYGAQRIPPPTLVRHPVLRERAASHDRPRTPNESLRFVYTGRLERRKGVQNLLRAITGIEPTNWDLTLIGADTSTAPLEMSMRAQLELMAAGDPRIRFVDEVPRSDLPDLLSEADVCVLPSLWDCWPYAALEAYGSNRPVLATPTGGFRELVAEGESGWLTRDATAGSLADALERLVLDGSAVDAVIARGGAARRREALTDVEEIRQSYADLAERTKPRRRRRPERPLVSVVVPYFQMDEFVEDALRSAFEQTYFPLEVIVVNDGSFRPEDRRLAELAVRYPFEVVTQQNAGLGAARNFGIRQSRGRYVFPLDADNMAASTFVERCVEALERDDALAYVTSWSHFVDERGSRLPEPDAGSRPLGNGVRALAETNAAGDAAAVIRRRLFDAGHWYSHDATSYEDWLFYRELAAAGHFGHVIPEPLLLYRLRSDSMVRTTGLVRYDRLMDELSASLREREVAWTA